RRLGLGDGVVRRGRLLGLLLRAREERNATHGRTQGGGQYPSVEHRTVPQGWRGASRAAPARRGRPGQMQESCQREGTVGKGCGRKRRQRRGKPKSAPASQAPATTAANVSQPHQGTTNVGFGGRV